MKANKQFHKILLLLLLPFPLFAQEKVITLTSPLPANGSTIYEAQQAIYLNPPFSYTAINGSSFTARINESLITPAGYITSGSIDNRTLDTGLSVGSVDGSAGVGQSGAANYQINLTFPPGINGMQPNISLVYNSQGGNGIAGWGFNIAGLSAVGRIPKTIYSDGAAEGMLTSSDAKYALDGVPLIIDIGKSGADGTEYRLETENFSKVYYRVTFNGTLDDAGSEWFEVKTKDGLTMKYGSTTGKLIAHRDPIKLDLILQQSTAYVQTWYLDRMENQDGIGVDYEYESTEMGLYIKKISYSGNTVDFFYDSRKDSIPVYLGNKTGFQDRILRKITVRCEGDVFRTYDLEYAYDRFSRLVRITEGNGAGEKKNPTVFEWGSFPATTNISVTNPTVTGSDYSNQYFTGVDLNGDGLTDMVSYYRRDMGSAIYTTVETYFAKKDGDNVRFESPGGIAMIPDAIDYDNIKIKYGGFLTGDYYGTGVQNAILPIYTGMVGFLIFGVKETYSYYSIGQQLVSSSELPEIAVGDVDNDGKTEILYIEKEPTNGSYVLRIGGEGKPDPFTEYPLSITNKPEKIIVADFNGDGMQDVMVFTKYNYHIYWNRGGSLSNLFSSSNKTTCTFLDTDYDKIYLQIQAGDFNGDGLPDFVMNLQIYNDVPAFYYYSINKWYLAINQGSGNFSLKELPQITAVEEVFTNKNDNQDQCFVTDFDGDGKSDLIINDSEYKRSSDITGVWGSFVTHKVYWYRSTGNDFDLVDSTTYNKEDAKIQYFAFGDFKGTGSNQMMFYGYDCYNGQDKTQKWRLYDNAGLTAESGKIKKISDGLNNRTEFAYKSLTDTSIYKQTYVPKFIQIDTYTHLITSTYPVVPLAAPLYAVATMKQSNGIIPDPVINKYTYKNGRVHMQGKGFLGFEQVKVTDSISNTTQVQDYGALDPTYFYPVSNTTTLSVGTKTVSTTSGTNTVLSFGGKHIFPYMNSSVQKDFLNGVSVTRVPEYNADGNMTKETVSYVNDDTKVQDVTEVSNLLYAHYGGNGIPNKVTSSTQTRTYNGEPPFTAKQLFDYDDKGHLTQEMQYANMNNSSVTKYLDFNSLGLPAKMRDSTMETVRETSFEYDNCGRTISTTDPIGQVSKTAYDKWGRVAKETDPLNLNTIHAYDNWSREILVTYPDNTREMKQLAWAGSGSDVPPGALYRTTATASGEADAVVYYDATGRELRALTSDAFNRKIYSDTKYNAKGQVASTSLPYFSTDAAQWTACDYLDDGRKQSETGLGLTTKYNYGILTDTITTPDGKQTAKTRNAKGDVVKVEEIGRGGLIQYHYHSSGQPRSITANGSTFSMECDPYGRQSKLIDPNAGTTAYTYYVSGELKTQTDARNNKFAFNYDKLGRETTRTVTDGTTNIVSITSTAYNNYGIDSVKRDDMRLCYKYDPLGRVQSLTEKVGADSYTTGYTYDANGMLQTRTYPSGFAVQYSYVNGAITAIRKAANSAAIWELTGINAMGQITSYRNGGDFNDIELGYDTYFNPTTKKLRGVIYAEQNVNPQTGNLSSRSVGAFSESFGYDSQNRLTSWSDSQSAIYSDNGNIEFKTGVGNYSYDAQHPHAVAGVTENIAALNQDIVYNEAGRATSIEEGDYRMTLDYGVDDQRVKTFLYENGALIKEKHFASGYEKEIVGNSTREINYIDAPSGLTAIVVRSGGVDSLFFVYTDHQGSILQLNNEDGTMVEQRVYDPWGRERDPNDWDNYLTDTGYRRTDRGYIGQEHLPQFGLINLNARLYDPLLGRFLSPDPFVQAPDVSQNFNRYSYAFNNPMCYIDPDGEIAWFVIPLICAAVFATGNTVAHAIRGDINNVGDFFKYFGQGAVTGFALGCAWQFAPLIPYVGQGIQTAMTWYTYGQAGLGLVGTIAGGENGAKTFLGNFYLDENNWLGGVWQGFSRHTWEMPQSLIGHGYTQIRNLAGNVSRVDYFGGATFATNENAGYNDGLSLGNFINTNIDHEITGNFDNYVLSNPMYMHEYGHTIDSRAFGLSYLFAIGIPSIFSANKANNDPSYHHYEYWTETRANRRAEKYFKKHFNINWNYPRYPLR